HDRHQGVSRPRRDSDSRRALPQHRVPERQDRADLRHHTAAGQAACGGLPASDRQLYRADEAGALPRREDGRRPGVPAATGAGAKPCCVQRAKRIRSEMKERTMNLVATSKLLSSAAAVLLLQACATTCPTFDACIATSPRLDA